MATSCLIATNGSGVGLTAMATNTLKMVPPPPMETQRGHPGYHKHGTTKSRLDSTNTVSDVGGVGPTQTVTSTRLVRLKKLGSQPLGFSIRGGKYHNGSWSDPQVLGLGFCERLCLTVRGEGHQVGHSLLRSCFVWWSMTRQVVIVARNRNQQQLNYIHEKKCSQTNSMVAN